MTSTKEEIYTFLSGVLNEQFEVDESSVHYDALLYDDLDIDSIDAINLVIELKQFTKTKINIENFHEIRTVGDIVNAVHSFLANKDK